MSKLKFTIVSLFNEALQPYLNTSMMWKAQDQGLVEFDFVNLRDFGLGPHKSVDDTPYGGGDGMLLRVEPVFAAIESIKKTDPTAQVILPTPVGKLWNQDLACKFAEGRVSAKIYNSENMSRSSHKHAASTGDAAWGTTSVRSAASTMGEDAAAGPVENTAHYVILCPHYEGYDERTLTLVDHKISLGQFILTGGELPALVIIDSIVRLIPGVLGGAESAKIESFSDGNNLEYPQYTKPAEFRGMKVPEVLLSGNHGAIAEWRAQHSKKAD